MHVLMECSVHGGREIVLDSLILSCDYQAVEELFCLLWLFIELSLFCVNLKVNK